MFRFAALTLTFCLATSLEAASFTPLGLAPTGSAELASVAYGVSDGGGFVVGRYDQTPGVPRAFRWSAGDGMVALEFLDGLSSGSSTASSISANGLVIVGQSTSLSGQEAFRWSAEGGMVGLGDISGGDFYSGASDVSANGDVVVGAGRPGDGRQQAFRWTTSTGLVPLSDLPGGQVEGGATAVSADGHVAVGQSDKGTYEAVRWIDMAAPMVLGDLPPDPNGNSAAGGVSGDGSVVVGFAAENGFRWTEPGGMAPTPGFYPTDVSASGLTMAGGNGYFWRFQDTGPQNLLDFLMGNGVVSAVGWSDLYISAISDDGNWLVGSGTNSLGDQEAFVANIEPVPIPPAAVDDGPIAVIEGVAQALPVGVNDTGFTNPVTVAVTTQPAKGTITAISPPGPAAGMTVTYTANVGAVGDDSFVYEMTDSSPAADSATVTLRISQDTDGDGVVNETDNCTLTANADQRDTNGDGYGNICDPDFNNNGIVDSQDGAILKATFGSNAFPDFDLNGNGIVDSNDGARLKAKFGKAPGPSGLRP